MGDGRRRLRPPFQPPKKVMETILEFCDTQDRHALSTVSRMWHEADGETRTHVSVKHMYAAEPFRLTRRFKNLRRIKIKGRPRASDYGLLVADWGGYARPWVLEIADSYPRLVSLHLKRMVVTDEDLAHPGFKNLQELRLQLCAGFSTTGLQFLAQGCRSLRVLSLRESTVEDQGALWLHELALNNRVLEVLDVECLEATSIDVQDLERLPTSLKSLKLPAEIPQRSLRRFLQRAIRLTELATGCFGKRDSTEDESVPLPAALVSLSGLHYVPDSYLPHLRAFGPRLVKLDLKAVPALSTAGFAELLSWCGNVQDLEVSHDVEDDVLVAIGRHCRELKRLRVERVGDDADAKVTQRGVLAVAEGCPRLEHFLVYAKDMTNAAFSAIGRNCQQMRDFRFILVHAAEQVSEDNYDDGVKDVLRGCPSLKRLAFYAHRYGALTDTGLEYIGMYGGHLKWLLLGCAGSTGTGMRHLGPGVGERGLRHLEKLEIRDCPLSGDCLANSLLPMFHLGQGSLFKLSYLWIQGNIDFTPAHIENFRGRSNLFLEVTWPQTNAPFQLFAYCSLAEPRTDRPPSVELVSQ